VTQIQRHTLYASLLLALSTSTALRAQSQLQTRFEASAQVPPAPVLSSSPAIPSPLPDRLLPEAPSALLQQSAAPQQATPQQAAPQQATPPPANETEAQRKDREQREEAEREVKEEEKQRAGGVLPLFNVVISGAAVPLTPKEKFDLSFHTIIDPYTFGLAIVFGGGLGELEDSHTGYGHGPSGLFKRIGASYADNAIGNVIGNAALPVVLHQDPRYYRKGTGSVGSRILYSAMTTFICFGDNGHKQFNTSNVLGNFISGAISNAYYPQDERGVALTLENGSLVTAEGMLGAQLLEFSPDFSQYMQRRRQRKLAARAAAAQSAQPSASMPDATSTPPASAPVPPASAPAPPAPPQP
jgi:hypothetical protein